VPVVLLNVFGTLPLACRAVDLPVFRVLRVVIRPSLVGAIPGVIVCAMFRILVPPASLAGVIGEGAVVGLTYCATVVGLGLTREDRARYTARLLQMRRGNLAK
jgi:hypothetical protein